MGKLTVDRRLAHGEDIALRALNNPLSSGQARRFDAGGRRLVSCLMIAVAPGASGQVRGGVEPFDGEEASD